MNDVFSTKHADSFFERLGQFAGSIESVFPTCSETKDWNLWINNVIIPDEKERERAIKKWVETMNTPIAKGCAKYSKAVESILGSPCTVFHAIAYRDMPAAEKSTDWFGSLHLPTKVASMSAPEQVIFWEYLEALNKHAFDSQRKTLPRVPTSDEISADIARRKSNKNSAATAHQGFVDMWRRLCVMRGATAPTDVSAVAAALEAVGKESFGGSETVADACKRHDPSGFRAVAKAFPYLEANSSDPTDEEWALLAHCFTMATMESAIPAPMMRGIESVANRLVMDMQNGTTDLASLNMENIGQEVLNGVSQSDMSAFANNIDKILPVIQGLRPPNP